MSSLATLISRELEGPRLEEQPMLKFGEAGQSKKGEDFYLIKTRCPRTPGDSASSTISVFAIFDGHNGRAAAIYSKDNVLKNVLSAIPPGLSRQEWSGALPRALVAGFVKTDKEFQSEEQSSGTTVTFVVVDGWTVTVASVGDSRCIIESQGVISLLTVDHRLEVNEEERHRIKSSGGEVGRLSTVGGAEIGPLRCWPGGLCLSRSIGDLDVGEFIVPIPFVKQIKLPSAGGRIVIASDGVWDALNSEKVARCCRGLSAELAANQVVKESLRCRGLRDDTTCVVVDILPPVNAVAAVKKRPQKGFLASMLRTQSGKFSARSANKALDGGKVEELFEEGSAVLSERLGPGNSVQGVEQLVCAVCQAAIAPSEGISVHAGSFFSTWEGPFLCVDCKRKQDAMEGRSAVSKMSGA
ncbi:unnamed protein product [Calypogeia fissa]